jgi:membrane protein
MDRGRILRTLTFWLRPAFALRVLGRFQQIAGFDRSIALASSALTGIVPLAIVTGAALSEAGGNDFADRLIERYDLSGAGADAIEAVFSPAGGTSTSVGIFGFLLLIVAVLGFSRAVQRLFEQTWELSPLSVRNSVNGLVWAGCFLLYVGVSGAIHGLVGRGSLDVAASVLVAPVSAAFLLWSGRLLSGGRLRWHELWPFALIAAVLLALYSIGATVYVPNLFDTYAARYGAIGAVFAMISTLVCIMVVLVGSAALGREVRGELDRIESGQRPPDDEVRREWDRIVSDLRARWTSARGQLGRVRPRRKAA